MANSAHVCGGIYMERMLKLQAKIEECGFYQYFDLVIPQQYVDFGWGGQDTDAVALFGNQLATSKCLEKPNYIFEAAEGILYTVVCFDADRPDCAATGCYLHWVRVNVTGDTKYSSGRDLVRWQPPHPQNGLHRFFFVVFHQPTEMCFDGTQITSKDSKKGRSDFNLRNFARDNHLEHIIGVNCCRLGPDPQSYAKVVAELCDDVPLDKDGRRVT